MIQGGLIAGVAAAAKSLRPNIKIIVSYILSSNGALFLLSRSLILWGKMEL